MFDNIACKFNFFNFFLYLKEIESSDARHFVVLFRDYHLQYRGIYSYSSETDYIEKIIGQGPLKISEDMIEKYYKWVHGMGESVFVFTLFVFSLSNYTDTIRVANNLHLYQWSILVCSVMPWRSRAYFGKPRRPHRETRLSCPRHQLRSTKEHSTDDNLVCQFLV